MKLLNLIVSSVVITSSSVYAFKNTAPLVIQLDDSIKEQLTYVTHEDSLPICSILSSSKNLVFQIPSLSNQDLVNGKLSIPHTSELIASDFYKFTPFYKYNNINDINLECEGTSTIVYEIDNFEEDDKLVDILDNDKLEANEIIVFKFPQLSSSPDARISELNKIDAYINLVASLTEDNKNFKIIIQGLPASKHSSLNSFLGNIEGLLHKKRDYTDYDALKQELDEAFKEIEEMIENETDGLVTISNSTVATGDGLFARYQFFTPGIWMGTLVSFFLVSVLIILFQWLASMQISYKSFEKQISSQKKNQ